MTNIDSIIAQAIKNNDSDQLDKLLEELFEKAKQAPAPYAPALQLRETTSDAAPVLPFGDQSAAIAIANRISRAKRRIQYNLKTAVGFSGLRIVSEGDSWFQYPLRLEDVIDHLASDSDKAILSLGAAADEVSTIAVQAEFVGPIREENADVFMFSAGGNDLLGAGRLEAVLRPFEPGVRASDLLNETKFSTRFASIQDDYRKVVSLAQDARAGLKILGHGYDLPFPMEEGPWFGAVFERLNIPFEMGRDVVEIIMHRFNSFLLGLEEEFTGFKYIDVRGTVGDSANSWFDELHPRDAGFRRVAEVFRTFLGTIEPAGDAFATGVPHTVVDPQPISAPTYSVKPIDAESPADQQQPIVAFSSSDQRWKMAQQIVSYEARQDSSGRIAIYRLPSGDGGGSYEVAGINDRYHKEVVDKLVALIRAGRHDKAEELATIHIADYTDRVDRWCRSLAIEFFLRDCCFNRGPGGAAWIVQKAVGVETDMLVGPLTLAAIAKQERDAADLLKKLRAARETYERVEVKRNESSRFWDGLVNRWNKAEQFAATYLSTPFAAAAQASRVQGGDAEPSKIVQCRAFTAADLNGELSDFGELKAELKKKFEHGSSPTLIAAFGAGPSPEPKHNVVGIGVGEKHTAGKLTGIMAVKVYVRDKFAMNEMRPDQQIPPTLSGLPVDIEEVGTIIPHVAIPDPRIAYDVPPPGCSIGYDDAMAGTFGALVTNGDGNELILSNNHVLAGADAIPVGAAIYQQGKLDVPNGAIARQIGTLYAAPPLGVNDLDVALAAPLSNVTLSADTLHIGAPTSPVSVHQDMLVQKFGRTTSHTVGYVSDLAIDILVSYATRTVAFNNQIAVKSMTSQPFSKPGDSGSLVMERGSKAGVGLLFAGSPMVTFMHPIGDVLSALKVRFPDEWEKD